MKKFLLSLATILLTLQGFSFEYNGLNYNTLDEGTCEFVGPVDPDMTGGEVMIPKRVYNPDNNNKPYKVTAIGSNACYNWTTVTSIIIPNSVTTIGYHSFSRCFSLTSVEIPNSVTSIERDAFGLCTALVSVEIPASVISIGERVFLSCTSLTAINVHDENENYTSIDGVLFDKHCTHLKLYPEGKPGNPYKIPQSVTSIEEYAFYHCSSLATVEIPGSVTSIGEWAFADCSSLTSVEIPNSVTSIGEYAFYHCSSLTSVGISNSVTSIGEGAFSSCSSLTSVQIPNSVTSIGEYAFSGCSSLTSVGIPNSVAFIGRNAFSGCSSLTSGEIPNSVTSIGEYAFADCSSLTSTEIPNSVTSIGEGAFYDCSSLTSVYYASENPVSAPSDVFPEKCYAEATLYLPESAISKAASVEPWCLFNNIRAYDFNGIEEVAADFEKDSPMEIYTLDGVKMTDAVEALPSGIYVVKQNGKTYKIAVK